MELTVDIVLSVEEIPEGEYNSLHHDTGGSVFYDRRFLLAAEISPLLPVINVFYLVVRAHRHLLAVIPVYLQKLEVVDPFNILSEKAGLINQGDDLMLVSHIMHCFDSRLPSRHASLELHDQILHHFRKLAVRTGASYFGLLNVSDPFLLSHAGALGMNVFHMLDRWHVPVSEYTGFDNFIDRLPYDGRGEMRRQLRKFEASGAELIMMSPPFGHRLRQLTELCQKTTTRHGTPHYFPSRPLEAFCRQCGDLIRLNLIEHQGELLAGMICFLEDDVLHLWSAGMQYEGIPFSPYTLAFAGAYRYAFEHGLTRVEAGRLNARIKTRLGLQPLPLSAVVSERLTVSSHL